MLNIVWKGSPNYIKRTKAIKKIVIHWFGVGTLESANTRFQNKANQVSAHYGISKGRIWQWVKEENTAFQAGNLSVNHESIGIEHDATTSHNLSDQDYALSAQLVREIAMRHGIPLDRAHIIGHREIKATQCPGTIDIDRIINMAKSQGEFMFYENKGTVYGELEGKLVGLAVTFEELRASYPNAEIVPVSDATLAKLKINWVVNRGTATAMLPAAKGKGNGK